RRPGTGVGLAAVSGPGERRQDAAPGPDLARAAGRRRGSRLGDDADPRLLEREGEARARLGAPLSELARWIRRSLIGPGARWNLDEARVSSRVKRPLTLVLADPLPDRVVRNAV